jgi:hypothetical protein
MSWRNSLTIISPLEVDSKLQIRSFPEERVLLL